MSSSPSALVRVCAAGLVVAVIVVTIACVGAAAGAPPEERGAWVALSIIFGAAALGMASLTFAIERRRRRDAVASTATSGE